jgi:hypothetical protein
MYLQAPTGDSGQSANARGVKRPPHKEPLVSDCCSLSAVPTLAALVHGTLSRLYTPAAAAAAASYNADWGAVGDTMTSSGLDKNTVGLQTELRALPYPESAVAVDKR